MTDTDRDRRIRGEADPYHGVAAARDRVDVDHVPLTGEACIGERPVLFEARGFGGALVEVERHDRFQTMYLAARRDGGMGNGA
jgi:hypothetical protein